jgi:hypothetical protein
MADCATLIRPAIVGEENENVRRRLLLFAYSNDGSRGISGP